MQEQISFKSTICIFLFLHTAVAVMMAIMAALSGKIYDRTLMFFAMGIASTILTLYTSKIITRYINARIETRVRELYKFSSDLQSASERLDRYANDLQQRESAIKEREQVIAQQVKKISAYGDKMTEIVLAIDSSNMISPKAIPADN